MILFEMLSLDFVFLCISFYYVDIVSCNSVLYSVYVGMHLIYAHMCLYFFVKID